jgi:hypothetical protein
LPTGSIPFHAKATELNDVHVSSLLAFFNRPGSMLGTKMLGGFAYKIIRRPEPDRIAQLLLSPTNRILAYRSFGNGTTSSTLEKLDIGVYDLPADRSVCQDVIIDSVRVDGFKVSRYNTDHWQVEGYIDDVVNNGYLTPQIFILPIEGTIVPDRIKEGAFKGSAYSNTNIVINANYKYIEAGAFDNISHTSVYFKDPNAALLVGGTIFKDITDVKFVFVQNDASLLDARYATYVTNITAQLTSLQTSGVLTVEKSRFSASVFPYYHSHVYQPGVGYDLW